MSYVGDILRILLLLPPEATAAARSIDWLHFTIITITVLGAGSITLAAAFFCFRYRAGQREPHERHERPPTTPAWAELSIAVGLFGLFVAFWVVGYRQYVALASAPEGAYDIYVSGKQWMWKFAYPDGSHTAGTLYVPAGRPVRLILTSRDVIHSFFVPDFRLKQDAVPGRYTSLWFQVEEPGAHRVFCAEYCGTEHSQMLAKIVALSPDDFARWLDTGVREQSDDVPDELARGQAEPSLAGRGEKVAATYGCLRCHTVDGSPHIGPTWAGLFASEIPLQNGENTVADVAYLTESMMDPRAKVHQGYAAVMPSYLGYLKAAEVGALIEFIKSLREVPAAPGPVPSLSPDAGVYQLPLTTETPLPAPAGEIGVTPQRAYGPSMEQAPAAGDRVDPLPLAPADDLGRRLSLEDASIRVKDGGAP